MTALQIQPSLVKANLNKINNRQSANADMPRMFGKSFLEQVAQVVSGSGQAQQQKMQSRKRKYSNEKKFKDDEDERCELLGKMRVLERKWVLG